MSSTTPTHCPYCALQCGMNLSAPESSTGADVITPSSEHAASATITVSPRPEFPTNRGGLCRKGWTSAELLSHPERLTTPLLRRQKGANLAPVSWDEALGFVAGKIEEIQDRYGSDSIGVFGGGGLTNEKAYLLGKFARVALRTPHIDYNGRFCMSSAATANQMAFGLDRGLPFPIADIAGAEAILLIGSNVAETMPPIMQYFDEQRNKGGKLIVIDPRATPTAKAAAVHLQLTPGTDAALANGLLHVAVRDKLVDQSFIAERTNGFESVAQVVASYWPDRVERMTGVPVKQIVHAAHLLGEAATAMVLSARGTEQQSKGVDNVLAFINLALALGKAGKPFCGYGCITGQGNGQGGREHGQKADQLPGYRKIDNPEHRAYIAGVWGVPEDEIPGPGKSAYELLDTLGCDGGLRALFVMGSNIAVSAPNAGHIGSRLAALDLLVVSDIFLSETAQLADVVLPTAQWAEEEGTMTNLEGRVIRRRRAILPPPEVRSDLEIIAGLADRLGKGRFFSDSPRTVFDELRIAVAGGIADYSGITYERIEAENGVFWPCPGEGHPGTPRLFLDRFATPDGRARFHAVVYRPAAEEPDDQFPLYLTTGRIMQHYQSGAQTRRVRPLSEAVGEPFIEIHPSLAAMFGIADGNVVRAVTRRGSALFMARLVESIRMDTVFAPFHWGGQGCANLLTNPALDPQSKMPEFKVCAVRIERA